MPWRTNTLTEYKPPDLNGDSLDLFGDDVEEVDFDALLGSDVDDREMREWQLVDELEPQVDDFSSGNSVDASRLGATQAPRGPVLDDRNFTQMLTNSFI